METQLSNIVPIAALEDIVLLIKEEDVESPNAKCCQLNISSNEFVFFKDIETVLKFTAFEEILKESWESCREDIYKRVKDSIIVEVLQGFEGEVNEIEKMDTGSTPGFETVTEDGKLVKGEQQDITKPDHRRWL